MDKNKESIIETVRSVDETDRRPTTVASNGNEIGRSNTTERSLPHADADIDQTTASSAASKTAI